MKKMKCFISMMLVIFMLPIISFETNAAVVLSASRTARNKTLWCWASAASIVGKNFCQEQFITCGYQYDEVLVNTSGIETNYVGQNSSGEKTAYAAQRQGVIKAKDSDGNFTGNNLDQIKAMRMLAGNYGTGKTVGDMSRTMNQVDKNTINSRMNSIYVSGCSYKKTSSTAIGHTFVLKFYNSYTDEYLIFNTGNNYEFWVSADNAFENGLTAFSGYSNYIIRLAVYLNP